MENELKLYFIMLIIILVLSVIWLVYSLTIFTKLKIYESKMNQMYVQLQNENSKRTTEYSDKMLEFVKMFIGQIAVLKFRTFVDSHNLGKITKANIQKLVAEVADTVHKSINIDKIDFEDTLFTKDFYEKYIIETSVIMIKELLDKTKINNDDE